MRLDRFSLSRRQLLAGGTALAAAGLTSPLPALAKAPKTNTQAPYFYRFTLGDIEATVVSDGVLSLGEPAPVLPNLPKEEIAKLLTDNFLAPDNLALEQNALVINNGDRLVLFDTGMGALKIFGPRTGRLLASLKQAGIDPKDIDAVVATHGHADHVGGIVDEKDTLLFPNAQIWISQADYDFWTDESKLGTPMKDFIAHARKNLVPHRGRIQFFKDGQEFLPSVQAIASPGHTVGHTMFMITSGGKSICNIGDLTNHQILFTERPRTEYTRDTDAKQAVATRIKMLDMLASNRIPMLAYHFPWPGIGHVSKRGDGFRYHPSPMQMARALSAGGESHGQFRKADPAHHGRGRRVRREHRQDLRGRRSRRRGSGAERSVGGASGSAGRRRWGCLCASDLRRHAARGGGRRSASARRAHRGARAQRCRAADQALRRNHGG